MILQEFRAIDKSTEDHKFVYFDISDLITHCKSSRHRAYVGVDSGIYEQCTNLRDRDGILIYEGDLVEFRKKVCRVKFGFYSNGEDEYSGFFIQDPELEGVNFGTGKAIHFNKSKIVGNIFGIKT